MTPGDILLPAGAAVLVGVAGLCAAADAALSRVSRVRVEEYLREGRRGAKSLRRVVAEPPHYLNLVLLLRVVGELTAAVMVAVWAVGNFGYAWSTVLITAAVMVVVSYVVVGVSPRTIGRQHADRVALLAAPVAYRLAAVLGPVPRLLIALGNAVTPGRGFRDGPFTSEAELRDLVDLAEASKVIESDERQMIHSVFELGDTIVREVMVPRTDIVFIERTKTLRQAMSLALRSGFSRIPVVGEHEDDVVGIAYLRDLARRTYEYRESESTERVESLMRPATFVPDSLPVDELLRHMQADRIHVAVVVDEYGGTAGLVTIEDILEEIVGEITDEYDRELPRIEELPDGAVRVTARLPVDELEQIFGLQLEPDDDGVETVGGLLAQALGRVPIPGATARVGILELVAEGSLGRRNRVATVVVRATSPDGPGTDPQALPPAAGLARPDVVAGNAATGTAAIGDAAVDNAKAADALEKAAADAPERRQRTDV
jgi:CBS domain containing-hemolysin-like protein